MAADRLCPCRASAFGDLPVCLEHALPEDLRREALRLDAVNRALREALARVHEEPQPRSRPQMTILERM